MSASLEGRIDIRLAVAEGRISQVEVTSSRPQLAQALLSGHTPDEAADLVGRVFTLCGKAQRIAALAACAAAMGVTPSEDESSSRSVQVLSELAQEHAWRLLLSWPQQTGAVADMETLLHLRKAAQDPDGLAERLDDALSNEVLASATEAVFMDGLSGFDAWSQRGQTLVARLFTQLGAGLDVGVGTVPILPPLHRLTEAELAMLGQQALADVHFCAQPTWRGEPAETGAVARMQEHPLMRQWVAERGRGAGARLLARLLELAGLPARLRGDGPALVRPLALAENIGVAGVETSRGLLLHVVRLDAGKVQTYRIVAPTEWNFHPAGPLVQALANLPAEAALESSARQTAMALDPCVEYGLEISHA